MKRSKCPPLGEFCIWKRPGIPRFNEPWCYTLNVLSLSNSSVLVEFHHFQMSSSPFILISALNTIVFLYSCSNILRRQSTLRICFCNCDYTSHTCSTSILRITPHTEPQHSCTPLPPMHPSYKFSISALSQLIPSSYINKFHIYSMTSVIIQRTFINFLPTGSTNLHDVCICLPFNQV